MTGNGPVPASPVYPAAEKPTLTTIIAVSTDSFTVTWKEKNSGNVSFLIAAALDPDNIAGTMVSSAAFHDDLGGVNKIATTTIYGLIPNGLYYVSVAAYKTDRLLSGFSSPDKAATLANPPGPATAWPAGRNTYQIRWNPNNNSPVTVYEVTRSFSNFEADISTAVGFNAGLTQTEVLLDGFTPALTHFVRMRAKNRDSIITAYSDSLAVTAPAPPGFLSATIKSGEAVVIVEPGEAVRLELGPAALPAEAAIYISPDPISAPLFVDPSRLEAAVDRLGGRRIFRNTMREFVAIAGNTLVETNFLGPVRLQISYAGLDADNNGLIDGSDPGINVMRLAIAVFNESRGDFTPCPNSTIELDAKTVSCRLEHFSVYVLAADIKPFSGADDVYAFPVPWRPNDSDSGNGGPNGITFANLPNEGEIRIYDIAAGLVKKIPLTGQAQIPWNGSNDDGFPAASGVYVWHLNGAAGSKTGKLMIIR
ncbi:MAG: hypothetical protein HY747_08630 [Elusimicrobia bacterium]|nr:hypothetical protein [Elusimicrobiota bacterium]